MSPFGLKELTGRVSGLYSDEQKKYLKKTQADCAFVYRPAQPKRQVIGDMVRDFVNRVFNGSAEPLLVHLVEEHDLSRKDLEEIARLRRKP